MAIKLKENFTEEFLADLKPEAAAYLVADLKTPKFISLYSRDKDVQMFFL